MEMNFEIGMTLYERLKKYAKFFCMTTNHFIQMLLTMGIDDYENANESRVLIKYEIKTMDTMIEKKTLLKEKQRELYKLKKKSNGNDVDILDDEIKRIKKEINRYVKRCKVNMSIESINKLDNILFIEKQNNKTLCRSDIICSFLEAELNGRVQYLTREKDILNDKKLNMPYKVVLNIPRMFWEYLDEQAEKFNIGVEEYIKILIENKYAEDN